MAKRKSRKEPEQESDYDGAWKEALRQYFREILDKYFPTISATIDWSVAPEWQDKEVSRMIPRARRRAGRVDLLVKVRLKSGGEQWILLHFEVQSGREADFEVRIARYNGGLCWMFERRVVSLVILADLDAHWRPRGDAFELADFQSLLRFPVCKLVDKVDHEWGEDDPALAVQVARAQIAALRTAGDPKGRYRAKWQLVRNLYSLGYNADKLREVFRLIDWMMRLPAALSRQFEQELTALEESLNMPYVTSVERIAEERGEARGKMEGGAVVLLKLLARRFGPLPTEIERRVRQLPIERLEAFAEVVLEIGSLQDLRAWLDTHEKPGR
jgi:hypothetical protein